ncbi:MAG: DNA-directed RNA polymerase subunit H [Candidatus Aenigmarchaeota archaeon]|nr:DNA-directed RNA polymerase subunit H [Candidatus Aenigmarchaeota archaeon]
MKEIDITKNDLVPKHTLLNDGEKLELFNQYEITLRQLPRILVNDPVVQNIGGKVGDVVKVVRKSPTAGEALYYRVIVRG